MKGTRENLEWGFADFLETDQSLQIERLKALVYGQAKILELVSGGAPLTSILEAITSWVEEQSNNELFAAILIMDPTGKRLLHGAAPSLPDSYNQAINGILIGPRVGTCGTAAFTKSIVIVEDMATDPLWNEYGSLALSYGLRASWSTPLINKDGKVLGTFGIYYKEPRKPTIDDIEIIRLVSKSALLAIEHYLAQEERNLLLVLSSPMPIGIYVGREMRIQTANDALLETWDRDKSVIGKTFREALPELEGQPFYQLLDEVYTTGRTYQATAERVDLFRHGRMEVTYYNFTYKALRDSNGEIYGVINTGIEVTDLVQARQKLLETQQSLRVAIEVAELGTWHIDLKTEMVYYSDRVREWFGLPPNCSMFGEVMDVVDENDRPSVQHAIQNAILNKAFYDVEFKGINRVTGQERIIHARGKGSFDENGEPLRLNGSAIDVTLLKISEQQLEKEVRNRTMQLEEANKHLQLVNENLKQFAYVASHDLQEPLRKINIFSDMLVKRNGDNLEQPGKMYLEKISGSAKRMSSLIRDLLEFSKVESKARSFVPTDINKVIRNIKTDYELLISEKQAVVNIGELCTIDAIPMQMNQLFYNLLGNAMKFSKDGNSPKISIDSRLMQQDEVARYSNLVKEWKYVEIIVRDNGIGFDQHFAEQIFVIFQRLHAKEKYEGTGIGLALCKKIIDHHQGEIYAESQEGKGSSFHVILPVHRR